MSMAEPMLDKGLLHIESTGQGEDVVLLHGWGMHGAYWQGLVDGLKGQYRLHCIDLPGHGKSVYRDEQSTEDFVTRILTSIESLTDQPFHLIGWSLGGLISQKMALLHAEKISKLILVASSPCFVKRRDWPHAMAVEVLNGFAENLHRDYKTTLVRFLALQVWGSDNQKQELRELKEKLFSRGEPDSQALAIGLTLLQDEDLRQFMQRLDRQVMLLGGERDTLVPNTALMELAKQFNNVHLEIIKGAGHAPFISHEEVVTDLIRAYLQE